MRGGPSKSASIPPPYVAHADVPNLRTPVPLDVRIRQPARALFASCGRFTSVSIHRGEIVKGANSREPTCRTAKRYRFVIKA